MKIQTILKDGKFVLNGEVFTVDYSLTNNDPSNNMVDYDVNRLYGSCGDKRVAVHPSFVGVYIPGQVDDVVVDPIVSELESITDTEPEQPAVPEPTVEEPEQIVAEQPEPEVPVEPEPPMEEPIKKSRQKNKQ